MNEYKDGGAIISRVLDRGDGGKITIAIWAPFRESGDWFTRWSISGLDGGRVDLLSGGIDSMQSMIFAMAAVGDRVKGENADVSFLQSANTQLLHTDNNAVLDEWSAFVNISRS